MIDKFINIMTGVLCIVAFLLTLLAGYFILALVTSIPCSVKAEAQSLEYKYGVVMGCMVKYKGEWVDYDRLRYVE